MLTFVPHKIKEDYRKVEFFRVNKELCNNEIYKDLSPTAILLYSLLCDRLSLTYTNELTNNIPKNIGTTILIEISYPNTIAYVLASKTIVIVGIIQTTIFNILDE